MDGRIGHIQREGGDTYYAFDMRRRKIERASRAEVEALLLAQDEQDQRIIKAVRTWALKNYNKRGWDILVECWEDDDILAALGEIQTDGAAILRIGQQLKRVDEYRKGIQREAF